MIAKELHISIGSVHTIVHDVLNKRSVWNLYPIRYAGAKRTAHCGGTNFLGLGWCQPELFLTISSQVTRRCFQYNPSTKCQTAEWKSPEKSRPIKIRATKSKVKMMLVAFFDSRGLIHQEFVPQGKTVTAAFYCEVMDRLLKRICRDRPELYQSGECFLLHDNAPAHSSLIVTRFLAQKSITVITRPTHRIWPQQISSSSQNWRQSLKGPVSRM